MKKDEYKKYLYTGIMALSVIILSILFFFGLFRLEAIKKSFAFTITILMPFIYGLIIAYLLSPVYNYFFKVIHPFLRVKLKKEKQASRFSSGLSILVSLVLMLIIIFGLLALVIPQMYISIVGIVEALPGNVNRLSLWLQDIFKSNPEIETFVMDLYNKAVEFIGDWVNADLMPSVERIVSGLSSGVISVLVMLKNMVIGIIVAVYVLASKSKFSAQAKKFTYSILKASQANLFIEKVRFTHKVFGGFIVGKLLDSLIIGIICFISMTLMKMTTMPYIMLISVIIGVTNVIPFFGPFIGAIPSAVIILLISPEKCLYFIIFIFVLQQFDGNILGPKILGDSTGLSSFWVLFAILFFGGIWGFVGMIIGVPLFAVIYNLVSDLVNQALKEKKLSTNTMDYLELDKIEEKLETKK